MDWMKNLHDVYNKIVESDARGETNTESLIPVAHAMQKAHIHAVINKGGEFVRAAIIAKEDQNTLIPVTAESATARTSGPAPHALHDNFWYVVGNLANYVKSDRKEESEKEGKKAGKIEGQSENYHAPYMEQLENWCAASPDNWKIQSIYDYLVQGTLIDDLIRSGLVKMDGEHLAPAVKIGQGSQDKAFVRFSVESEGVIHNLWREKAIADDYISFYLEKLDHGEKGLCYVTGQEMPIAEKHRKNIRWPGDGAKLISSNDTDNFTYRGRFTSPDQCVQIGYEVSEKAHSALQWLIQKNGFRQGEYAMVAWSSKKISVANPGASSGDLFQDFDSYENRIDCVEADLGNHYAKQLDRAVLSLNAELKEDPSINIMAINSSSIGRMAVLYYRELGGGEYVERLRRWHEETAWIQQGKFNKEVGKRYQFIGAPSLKDIVLVACGHEQNKKLSVDNKTSNYQINRLLSCVIDGTNIPVDLVKGAVARASKPHTMEPYNWEKCLSVACALVRKHRRDRYKEEWGMETKQNETNRSYLFGKMLAMADYAESLALKKMGANRPTTAMRYMDAFSRRPAKTWAIIEKRLIPYLNRLSPGQRIYFQRRLDEIIVKIDPEEFASPKKLDERYLIGFHSLRYELWRLKTENSLTQSQIDEGGEEAC